MQSLREIAGPISAHLNSKDIETAAQFLEAAIGTPDKLAETIRAFHSTGPGDMQGSKLEKEKKLGELFDARVLSVAGSETSASPRHQEERKFWTDPKNWGIQANLA